MALKDLLTDLSNFDWNYENAGVNISKKGGRHGGFKGGGEPSHSDRHSLHDDGVGFGVAPNDNPQSFDVRGYTITGTKTFDRPNQDAITIMTNGVGFPYTPFDSGVKTGPVNFLSGVYGSWGPKTLPLGFSFNMVDSLLSPGTPPVLSLNTLRHTIPEVGPSPGFTIDHSRYDEELGSQFNTVEGIISSQYTDTEKLHSSYGTQFHISGFNRDGMYITDSVEPSTPIFNQFTRSDTPLIKIDRYSDNFDPNGDNVFDFPTTSTIPYHIPYHKPGEEHLQPFIIRDIGSKWGVGDIELFTESSLGRVAGFINDISGKFLRAPIDVLIDRSKADITRISKFLESPNGLLFIAEQFILQAFNPTIETKVWNPLSLGSAIPLIHINRHLGGKRYTDVVPSDSAAAALSSLLPGTDIGPITVGGGDILSAAFNAAGMDIPSFGRIEMQSSLSSISGTKIPLDKRLVLVNPNKYLWPPAGGTSAAVGDAKRIESSQGRVLKRAQEQSGGGIKDLYLVHKFNKYSNENVYLNSDGILFYPEKEKSFGGLGSFPTSISQITTMATAALKNFAQKLLGGKKKQKSWKPANARSPIVTSGLASPDGSMRYVASPLYESITIETPPHKMDKKTKVKTPRLDIGRLGPGVFNPLETGYTEEIFQIRDAPDSPYGAWAIKEIETSEIAQLGALSGTKLGLKGKPTAKYFKGWGPHPTITTTPSAGIVTIGEKKLTTDANLGFENPIMISGVFVGDAYSDSNKYWSGKGTPTIPVPPKNSEKKSLGHASAPSAKQQIIFIHKGSTVSPAATGVWGSSLSVVGTPNEISTTFDHERTTGDEVTYTSTIPSLDKIHDGKNIYKDKNIYLPIDSGEIVWTGITKLESRDKNVKFPSKIFGPEKHNMTRINKTNLHFGGNLYSVEEGKGYLENLIAGSTTKNKGQLAHSYSVETEAPFGEWPKGLASIGLGTDFQGDIFSHKNKDGTSTTVFDKDLYDKTNNYLKELNNKSRVGTDKVGDPIVTIKTKHTRSTPNEFGARIQTAGDSTLKEPIKLQNFPLLNKQGSGNIGTEGQSLSFVDESKEPISLSDNLYGPDDKISTKVGDDYDRKGFTKESYQESIKGSVGSEGGTTDVVVNKGRFSVNESNIPQAVKRLSTLNSDMDAANLELGDNKVTVDFPVDTRTDSKAVGTGNILDRYKTLAYGDIPKNGVDGERYGIKTVTTDKGGQYPGQAKDDTTSLSTVAIVDDGELGLVKKTSADSNGKYTTDLTDKVNMYQYGNSDIKNDADYIKFKIYDVVNSKYIIFRAFLSGISETLSPEWSSEKYIGRPDSVHVYQGVDRSMSFEFMVVPSSKQELPILWEKLNYLVGLTYPTWKALGTTGNRMEAPFIQLTIGNMYNSVPGYFSSLGITVDDQSPWEIQDGFQLPHAVNVSCEFTHIGQHTLASQGKHYGLPFLRNYDSTLPWAAEDNPQLGNRTGLSKLMGSKFIPSTLAG
jgi:hypothetical protein